MQLAPQHVAIIGAGPIACASACYLKNHGHHVALWSPTGRRLHIDLPTQQACFQTHGAVSAQVCVDWLPTLQALSDYPVVLICLPGHLYQDLFSTLLPQLKNGQTVLISGALSLASIWLSDQARQLGLELQVGAWSTTATTAHFLADGQVHINELRSTIGVSSACAQHSQSILSLSQTLLGDRFIADDNPLASTLANINPIAHAAEVIPNLSRITRQEDWSLFACFGIEVGRIAQKLDEERLAIGKHFGFELRSLVEHYHRSYHVPKGPLHEMAAAIEAAGKGPLGPKGLNHRYVLEDMPFGLAFQERLAILAGIPCPIHSSALTLLEVVYDQDLRSSNFLLDQLLGDTQALNYLVNRLSAAA